ncbi:MAG: class I SAM-dependent methyltransferase [Sulfuritalea sp.]|nr:class I SAM-dependent methyltransferase [Sulfuritalea sp.]
MNFVMFQFGKRIIKAVLPSAALIWFRRRKQRAVRECNERLRTQDVFARIYSENLWGGSPGTFCSGSGSEPEMVNPYCDMVKQFVVERGVRTILDIGCGDFRVGRYLQVAGVSYVGIDIVPALIERNRKLFGSESIRFLCLDAIEEPLPQADLVLVRQVFQHLSNRQISQILEKLRGYQYIMVTEHFPAPGAAIVPNLDKPHGGDTRIPDGSAICLDKPPFKVAGLQTMLRVPASHCLVGQGETIETMLFGGKDVPKSE